MRAPALRSPLVSVVMPARNASAYVDQAVASILDQTLEDFELIIRDDGSTDDTLSKLQLWAQRDDRIRLFHGGTLGVVGSSNWVVSQARGAFVARMDADDLAAPERLERQVEVLRRAPETVLVGTLCRIIDESGQQVRNADLWRLARRAGFMPFPHTSIMFRRASFDLVGGYRDACPYWEDLDLCRRLEKVGRVAVICDALVSHRVSAGSIRLSPDKQEQIEAAVSAMYDVVKPLTCVEEAPSFRETSLDAQPALRPSALVSIHSGLLWSGGRPRCLRRMIHRCRLRLDVETLVCLSWAMLAQNSPSLLRLLLRSVHWLRNVRARLQIRRERVYLWQSGGAAVAVAEFNEAAKRQAACE